ncbi:hypothetical protein [Streptosporangium jomthongense]|uniref:Uncharacterized protein n=1 Tax=Streptosporangium jomthongense TaxID=1193683 RepID=A0ABV8FCR7_9ACTN
MTLGQEAEWGDLIVIRDDLREMADRLAELPYAGAAAAETAAIIAQLEVANAHARRLAEVWHAVERHDHGDGQGEIDIHNALAAYRDLPEKEQQ